MSGPEVHEVAAHDDSKRSYDEVWSSRPDFYFAAVGAAVGFGNVWRFPALSVEYGGGAFFIPYFLAFFIIGVPILILEIGFGQFWQPGDGSLRIL
jgi:SNF family Na+-dependent transporter